MSSTAEFRFMRVLTACGVRSVSLANRPITESRVRTIAALRAAGIHVSIIDVDTVEECRRWMAVGADLFNSRMLYPEMVESMT